MLYNIFNEQKKEIKVNANETANPWNCIYIYIYIYMERLFQAICLIKKIVLNLFKMGFVVISNLKGMYKR